MTQAPPTPDSPTPSVLAVIPARYASTRFPGKPLALIQGKPMIQHVWERATQTPGLSRVIIATDDPRIQEAAHQFGATVCMTASTHVSGTDRVQEVAAQHPEYPWILNLQGDEPFINPQHLHAAVAAISQTPQADLLTLVTRLHDPSDWHNTNIVKVALSQSGQALYFSRAPIPHHRDQQERPQQAYRHIGLYLYRQDALTRFTQLPPSPLEGLEKLEQLRALEAGMRIFAIEVDQAPIGIDTPDDLIRLEKSAFNGFPFNQSTV